LFKEKQVHHFFSSKGNEKESFVFHKIESGPQPDGMVGLRDHEAVNTVVVSD